MADDLDEDALFERLAKSLEAVRRDADLARSGGTEGISAGLARVEAELRGLSSGFESLRQRFDRQHSATARLDASAAKHEAEFQSLRQTVEALTRRVREQAEALAKPPARKQRPIAAASVAAVLAVVVLAGGAAAWIASGREPTAGTLVHRFVARLSELTGVHLAGSNEPTQRTARVAQATPNPEPVSPPRPAEPTAPTGAPAPTAAPSAATAAATPPNGTAAPVAPPSGKPSAGAPQPEQTAAAETTPVANPPPTVATPPIGQATTVATAIEQSSHPPEALHHLVLRATADSWVEVRQRGGHVLLRRILRQGETWAVPAQPDLLLNSGNAGALELEVDGVPAQLTGARNGVVRDVPLDNGSASPGARSSH